MANLHDLFEDSGAIAEDNLGFLEDLYQRFLRDPESVDASWRAKFAALPDTGYADALLNTAQRSTIPAFNEADLPIKKQAAVDRLIAQYRMRGHQVADNNPLKLGTPPRLKDLELAYYGLGEKDLDEQFYVDILESDRRLPLRDILTVLRQTYCEHVGAEYMHIIDSDIRQWIQTRLESTRSRGLPDPANQRATLRALTAAEGIEHYLHRKYVGQKRFSLEGAESLIPLLDELIESSCEKGLRELVIGMAHRGRINVLVNVLGKLPGALFEEFEGTARVMPLASAGDVKYHSGFSSNIETRHGPVHTALAFNPSHLEIIDPVAEGSVRARQDRRPGDGEVEVMAVLIHGDAAFAGQGVVMETLNMSETRAYTTGGTIHVVINNQIGFTTSAPFDARSTLYCTDVANMIQAPVFHVNGDDPEAVLYVTRLAVDYRMRFHRDVVIDLLCYRRHGHNEADEPAVTQPMMYGLIRNHPTVREIYAERLVAAGVMETEETESLVDAYQHALSRNDIVSRPLIDTATHYPKPNWTPFHGNHWRCDYDSGLPTAQARKLAEKCLTIPDGFVLHPRTQAILEHRREMLEGQAPLDWGFCETLAYASLLAQGTPIRLSGQDVGRGTFFHRHAILHDQKTGRPFTPLQQLGSPKTEFQIFDSILSEEGVLGFEYGYSSSAPETLVIWEAQFGDFANNAQVVIDQFIASGESKWGRLSGLTLFLPHGYEGQGPEHSSARIERYLQLCAEDNMQVAVPTTPAQIFHLLRRQIIRPYRKPLIVMTPKSLLRHKLAISTLDELAHSGFETVIGELHLSDPSSVSGVILCSGKVYYDLIEYREREGRNDRAIIRIEQLYPFPDQELRSALKDFKAIREFTWCQEEPANQGAWHQIRDAIQLCLPPASRLRVAARPVCAAPAVGQYHRHLTEQRQLVEAAFLDPKD